MSGIRIPAATFVLFVCAGWLFAPSSARPAPLDCPTVDFGGSIYWVCEVTDGDSALSVAATNDFGGELVVDLTLGGVRQLPAQYFYFFDLDTGGTPDFTVEVATFDSATREIRLVVTETDGGTITLDPRFVLTDLGTESRIDETVTVRSNVAQTIQGRLYVTADFDLADPNVGDETASASTTAIRTTEGETTGVFESVGGQAPDAFQVAEYPALTDPLFADQPLELSNEAVAGPADLESAFSWDKTFTSVGDTLDIVLRKRLMVGAANDADGDGIPDAADSCPNVPNVDQADQDQNGIGDACQCGDVNGDGVTNVTDALAIARGEVLSSDPNFGKCDVNGDSVCNVTDALAIARGEVSSAPQGQLCPAYQSAP